MVYKQFPPHHPFTVKGKGGLTGFKGCAGGFRLDSNSTHVHLSRASVFLIRNSEPYSLLPA